MQLFNLLKANVDQLPQARFILKWDQTHLLKSTEPLIVHGCFMDLSHSVDQS